MKLGDVLSLTLLPGQVLAVTTDANATCKVVRQGDSPGNASQAVNAVAASTTFKQGPFATATRFNIEQIGGNGVVTYSMTAPPTLASQRIIQATLTPASVGAANASGTAQSFTVTGASPLDTICVCCGNTGNATSIAGARVTAADTVEVKFDNPTAGALTPGAGTYTFFLAH